MLLTQARTLNLSEASLNNLPPLPIVQEIHDKINQIESGLIGSGFYQFRIMLAGSLVCGHYTKPKPASHSLNPNCPYDEVIECDMRIILPKEVNIMTGKNIDAFEEIVGAKRDFTKAKYIQRFGDEIPMVVLYDYKEITKGLGLEFEICVNSEPYFEIATVWGEVFTDQEVKRQTEIREVARSVLKLDYHEEFQVLKQVQTAECRYRVCANNWLSSNYPEIACDKRFDYKPLSVRINEHFRSKIKNWIEDYQRPYSIPYDSKLIDKFATVGMEGLLLGQPEVPKWLQFVERIKRTL